MHKDIIFILVFDVLITQVYTGILNGVNIELECPESINLKDGNSSMIYFVYTESENPNVTASLDNGVQLTVMVDWVNKTGLIVLSSSTFQQENISYGTYILTIEISGFNHTCYVTVNYEEVLQGLQILIDPTVPVNEDVNLTITVGKGSNFIVNMALTKLGGNEVMNLTTNDSGHSQILIIRVLEPGSYVLCVTVSNLVSRDKIQENIEAIYRINSSTNGILNGVNIELECPESINLKDGNSSMIYFVYTESENPNVTASLDNGVQLTVMVDWVNKTGLIVLSSSTFQQENISYGTYILTIEISGFNHTCYVTVNYEEVLQGLQILIDPTVPVNEDVNLTIAVGKGSNFIVNMALTKLGGNEVMNLTTNDSRHSQILNIRVLEPGSYVLCVTVSNLVSRDKIQENIEAIYRINSSTNGILNGINTELECPESVILEDGQFSMIYFAYTETENPNVKATLRHGVQPNFMVKWVNNTGFIVLNSSTFQHENISYGTYILTIEISGYNDTCNVTVNYDEVLRGLQIFIDPIIPVNENVNLTITVETGSNFITNITLDKLDGNEILNHTSNNSLHSQPVNISVIEPGSYVLFVTVLNAVSSEKIQKSIEVRYRINGLIISGPTTVVHLTENVHFIAKLNQSAKLPMGCLKFEINFDDGNISSKFEDFLNLVQNNVSFPHQYQQSGNYSVELIISNNFGSETYTFNFEVDGNIPIPIESRISLDANEYEFPLTANIIFTLNMLRNDVTPNNVVCTFDYGDSIQETERTTMKYGEPVVKLHIYGHEGDFDVVFVCSNEISFINKTVRVHSRSFRVEDFTFHYPTVIASSMTSPTVEPETVEFVVTLQNFTVFPTSVTITWYFDDGSPVVVETIMPLKIHTFYRRGFIYAYVKIDNKHGGLIQRNLTINIGVITFSVNRKKGHIRTDIFKYEVEGLENGYYLFSCKPGETYNLTGTNVSYSITYDKPGSYFPHVTGINGTYNITQYLPEVFYYVNIGSISFDISNYTLNQPPGNVQITFNIPETEGFSNCSIDMGDFIDKEIYKFNWNISQKNTVIFNYTYLTLGVHNVWINCSNPLTKIKENFVIESVNECFKVTGIFDRQYSNKGNPMKVYTSAEISLSNRMPVLCPKDFPEFHWSFSKYEYANEWTNVNKSLPHPPTGSVRFIRGEMSEGLYKITLKVSLSGTRNTYVIEATYVRFEKPPPFAYIVGGAQRIGNKATRFIDGLTMSYDAGQSVGANDDLNFTWTCKRFKSASLFQLESMQSTYNNTPSHKEMLPCSGILHNTTQGIAVLNATSDIPAGYALNVTTCINSVIGPKCSSYTQLLQIIPGNPPLARIQCDMNCKEKYAVTSRMNVRAVCDDCTETELSTLSYKWQIRRENSDSRIQGFAETGTSESSLVIKPNMLDEGSVYYLSLELTSRKRVATGQSVIKLTTNYPPYGGGCHVKPESGNATTTPFAIICSGWRDEGPRDSRNSTKDLEANEPLVYEYISFTKKKLFNGNIIETGIRLFHGGESSATEMLLSVGEEYFDYRLTIMIRVYDYYGDYIERNTTVQVFPDENMIPKDSEDTKALDYMMDVYDLNFEQIQAGGNAVATVQVIGSTCSLLGTNSNSTNSTAVLNNNNYPETGVEKKKQTIVGSFSGQMLNEIRNYNGFGGPDTAQVMRNIDICVNKAHHINEKTTDSVIDASSRLSDYLVSATSKSEPFPIETIKSIDECADGMASAIQKTLSSMLPDGLVDIDNEQDIGEEMVKDEVDTALTDSYTSKLKNFEIDALKEKLISEEIDKLKKKWKKQKIKETSAKKNVPKIMSAIENILKAKSKLMALGQPEEIITKKGIILSMEKVRKDTLLAEGRKREGVKIDFDCLPDSDGLEFGMTYFEKPPQIYGKGSSKISSPSVSLTTKDINGNIVSMPLSITVKNADTVHYSKYRPTINPNDPEEMVYVKYEVRDLEDATLIFIKPDSLEFESYNSFQRAFLEKDFKLYQVYANNGSIPSSSDNVFETNLTVRDWTHPFGFKILIKEGLLKEGMAYLGLKPIKAKSKGKRLKRSLESVFLQSYKSRSLSEVDDEDTNITSGSDNATVSINLLKVNFSIAISTTGCRMWSDEAEAWIPNGCKVSPLSTLNETICKCPKASSDGIRMFATTFYVPPNSIDFSTVFSDFDISNASIYGTVLGIIVLYLLVLIWVRKQDRKDIERWATYLLCDNDESDTYYYILTVHTGLRRGAGTKSNVNFNLVGTDMESGVRYLGEGLGKGFGTGSVRKFIMSTKYPLGTLTYLRIWHDSSGSGSERSWYLYKILVDDIQGGERYCFHFDQWLDLEEGDGQTQIAVPSSAKEDLILFSRLFSGEARTNFIENHLWFSILMRPERSSFSRVHRLSCILAFLFLTMITNAMFFRSDNNEKYSSEVQMGVLRFSTHTLYVSAVSIVITTVPTILVAMCFKYSKPKERRNEKDPKKSNSSSPVKDHFNSKEISSDIYTRSGFTLPHWSMYCGWILIALAVTTSGFFLILYSMEWGEIKSEKWLASFALSFVESVIIMDPLKIMFIALVVAIIIKSSKDELPHNVDVEKIRLAAANSTSKSQEYLELRTDVLFKNTAPPVKNLKTMKEKLRGELQARRALIQLIAYIIYTFVIYSISYINRDYRSFYMTENIQNYLVKSSKTKFGFSKVHTDTTFYEWMNSTLFPNYFPIVDYNDAAIGAIDKLFFGDFANLRIGPARLRQVRMNEESCWYQKTVIAHKSCVMHYTVEHEDTDRYCLNWEQYNSSSCILTSNPGSYFTSDAWRYIPSETIWGIQINGQYNTYAGGGYILNFEIDLINSQNLINELKEYNWIDRRTRAVFMEFTLYNSNANIFAYVIFLCEFTETGRLLTWADIRTFRPYQDVGSLGIYTYLCYFVYLIVLFISSIKTIIQIKSLRLQYFQLFWNKVDVICYILSYLAIVMWVFRFVYTQQAMAKYYDNKDVFINFQHIVVWDYSFNIVMGILVFVSTIRIMRILGYNKKLTQIANVLSRAWVSLLGFGILLAIILFCYAALGYLLFGPSAYTYRSVFISLGSLANTIIGKNSVRAMQEVSQSFAMFYFITYVVAVIFVFMTIFLAILNESISKVRAELANETSTYGIVDIFTDTIKSIFGLTLRPKLTQRKEDRKVPGEYKPQERTNLTINTVNVISLVRETFDSMDGLKDMKLKAGENSTRSAAPIPISKLYVPQKSKKCRLTKFDDNDFYDLTAGSNDRDNIFDFHTMNRYL